MVYPALLPLMRTPRLPVVAWTDAPGRFKWTGPFSRKTKSCYCACANTFQLACTSACGISIMVGHIRHKICEMLLRTSLTVLLDKVGTQWLSWLRHCATSRRVVGSIPKGVIGIFLWHNPSGRTMALGLNKPLTEMITRNISWRVNAAGA